MALSVSRLPARLVSDATNGFIVNSQHTSPQKVISQFQFDFIHMKYGPKLVNWLEKYILKYVRDMFTNY
jgi:hypothetical protein